MIRETKIKPIKNYLKNKEDKILVQAKIDTSLHAKVQEILKREDRSFNEVVIALLTRFVDELK